MKTIKRSLVIGKKEYENIPPKEKILNDFL